MEFIRAGAGKAELYRLNTRRFENDISFRKSYERLSSMRQRKIDAYRFRRDKNLSLGAGLLLDYGLSRYGLREQDVLIACGPNGKPYLPEYPRIHFNLSHSGEMALAVFAESEAGYEVKLGCDVEMVQQADLALAEKYFCPGEYRYVAGQENEQRQNEAFYRIWTLKESFLKAAGLGLSLELEAFEIQADADGKVRVCQQVDSGTYQFEEYRFGEYQAAVCFYERRE